jgi:hypothetical protein
MTLFGETIFLIWSALRDWRFHRICLSASDLKEYYTSASLPLRHLRQTCQLQDLGAAASFVAGSAITILLLFVVVNMR